MSIISSCKPAGTCARRLQLPAGMLIASDHLTPQCAIIGCKKERLGRAHALQVAREALPPYISKDTADSILIIGKAMRVLKQSSGSCSCREPGIPHCCSTWHMCQMLADLHL